MQHPLEPNEFELLSEDGRISIRYAIHGVVGPQLIYHDQNDSQGPRTFGSQEIEVIQESPMGSLITVTLENVPDADMRTLSLLVPRVFQKAASESIHTVAIFTISRGSIAPQSLEGQIQLYQPFELNGASRAVGGKSSVEPPAEVFRRWVHSLEEDADDAAVFRPQGWDFPPSRGREQLEINKDGTLTFFEIGLGDELRQVKGTWTTATRSALNITLENGNTSTIMINAAADDLLKVRRSEPTIEPAP